jgi:hypothetical protein
MVRNHTHTHTYIKQVVVFLVEFLTCVTLGSRTLNFLLLDTILSQYL